MVTYATGRYYPEEEVFAAIRELEAAGEPVLDEQADGAAFAGRDIEGMALQAQLRAGSAVAAAYVRLGILRREQLLGGTALTPANDDGNESKFIAYWWGYELYIDTPTINAIIGVLTIGAGIEGLLAVLAGAFGGPAGVAVMILGAVAAAMMGVGAGVLTLLNAQGRGLVVRGIWFPSLSYIWTQ
jgi:hypothetical protein